MPHFYLQAMPKVYRHLGRLGTSDMALALKWMVKKAALRQQLFGQSRLVRIGTLLECRIQFTEL